MTDEQSASTDVVTDAAGASGASGASGKRDLSVGLEQASIYGPLTVAPLALAFYFAFRFQWGAGRISEGIVTFFTWRSALPALVLGIVVHELLHGTGWALFGRKPWNVIKFGFLLATLTPYARCKEPLEVGAYRAGAALPGLLLGVLPMVLALLNGSGWLLMFGLVFTVCAGGDALILWLIRGVSRGRMVEDHPSRAGCYVFDATPPRDAAMTATAR